MEEIKKETLEQKVERLEKSNTYLTEQKLKFESGDDSLYHAVKKKMSEFAKLLNATNMDNIDLNDKNDKTFERVVAILEKCEKIAISASALGQRTGIEKKEEEKTPFVDSIAESRK